MNEKCKIFFVRVPSIPGPPPPPSPVALQPDQATVWAEQVFQMMLTSADQLLHVALYQWLIEKKYIDKLLNIKSQFIDVIQLVISHLEVEKYIRK